MNPLVPLAAIGAAAFYETCKRTGRRAPFTRPSVATLQRDLGLSKQAASAVRTHLGAHSDPEKALEAAGDVEGMAAQFYGVEYISPRDSRFGGFYYLNAGDPYDATLVFYEKEGRFRTSRAGWAAAAGLD